jgi:hypothetical protein
MQERAGGEPHYNTLIHARGNEFLLKLNAHEQKMKRTALAL